MKWAEAGWDIIHEDRFEIPSVVRVENGLRIRIFTMGNLRSLLVAMMSFGGDAMELSTLRSYLTNLALSIFIMIAIDALGRWTSLATGSSFIIVLGVLVQFPGAIAVAFAFDCFRRGRVQDTYKIRWWIESAARLLILAIIYNHLHFPHRDVARILNAP